MSHQRSNSNDDTRQHIISSLFGKKDDNGQPEETLITYLKVYEEDAASNSTKTRYLMLAVTKYGKVLIHKAKRNNNLSFSKGKTWNLEDMRTLEVMGPSDFALTMTVRRYHWTTDRPRDQNHFLTSAAKVYQKYTNGDLPELINFSMSQSVDSIPDHRRQSSASSMNIPLSSSPSRHVDLAPPTMRTQRSGSAHSNTSAFSGGYPQSEGSTSAYNTALGSSYGTAPLGSSARSRPSMDELMGRTRSRPSIDETRNGPSNTKSPLQQTTTLPPRRPSAQSGLDGIGSGSSSRIPPTRSSSLAPPSQPPRRPSDRSQGFGSIGDRSVSGNSEYAEASTSIGGMMRESSHEDSAIIDDDEDPPSRSEIPPPNLPSSGRGTPTKAKTIDMNGDTSSSSRAVPSPLKVGGNNRDTPRITTTLASPSIPPPPVPDSATEKSKPQRRKSFHPAPINTAFSREVLLASRTGVLPGAADLTTQGGKEESQEALMSNVEELLEGFDWTAGVGQGQIGPDGRKKGSADAIEQRLLDELAALDQANIHAFLESDDRIAQVLGHIDEALMELDDIDMHLTGYRMQLDAVTDDISFVESQNRGLQVQTSNQQALLDELRQLLQIVEVPSEDLRILAQESPQTQRGVQALEQAATSLYKALQAGRDTANAEVAATIARMREYQDQSAQFCKRILDYLDVTFKYQAETTLAEGRKSKGANLSPHTSMGEYLMMYEGLVLYVKEMDEDRYQKLCSVYMSTISNLHQNEIKDMLMGFMGTVKASQSSEPSDALFSSAMSSSAPKTGALAKSKTIVGLGSTASQSAKPTRKGDDNSGKIAELYQSALTQIVNQVLNEEGFINAFLHLTDTESTFADHMELDSYFRRQAARHAAGQLSKGMMQLIRSMMDLIFGFVDSELKNWTEAAIDKNPVSIIGISVVTERLAKEAEEENTSMFFAQLFDRQMSRQKASFDQFINNQLRTIENGKNRRRKGAAFFVRHFPTFVERIESQLQDAQGLPIRSRVNDAYEKVVNAIFSAIQQMAKMDRAEAQATEDKGQMSYNVVIIENMHHFVDDVSQLNNPSLAVYLQRAKGMYDDNLETYVKMMLRRYFGRLMDFFDGVERLLQSSPPSEVSMHNAYSKSNLKKVLKDTGGSKDLRKAIEALSKRVDKHFSEDETGTVSDASTHALILSVWKEIIFSLKREVGRAGELIRGSYGDSGLGLEYSIGDIEQISKRVGK